MNSTFPAARIKCLIVDDRAENLLALQALLRRDEIEVLEARSGVEALDLLLNHPDIALAILDVQMPEMDGFELAELMRGAERTEHIPIIFMTAGGADRHRQFKGYESGAVDFLYKPIDPHILRSKAGVFFELYRKRQKLRHKVEELSSTLRLNEMFTAVLGHDLRDPLHVILTAAQLLQSTTQEGTTRDLALRVEASGKRMARMIEDLLDLAQARLAGGIPLKREQIHLGTLTERVVQEHQSVSLRHRIELEQKGELHGQWDADRLFQLVSNLLGNAIHHGSPDLPVIVRADGSSPTEVLLSVQNSGHIEEELIPSLFDPFSRSTTDPKPHGGLGLGLYIAQKIAEAHRGQIQVESCPNARICFTLRIPRCAHEVLKL